MNVRAILSAAAFVVVAILVWVEWDHYVERRRMLPAADAPCSDWPGPDFIAYDPLSPRALVHAQTSTGLLLVATDTGQITSRIPIPAGGPILAATILPTGRTAEFAQADDSGVAVSAIDLATLAVTPSRRIDIADPGLAIFGEQGQSLVVTSRNGELATLRLDSGEHRLVTVFAPAEAVAGIALSGNGRTLFVAGQGLVVFDLDAMRVVTIVDPGRFFVDVAVSPDNLLLAMHDGMSGIMFYDLPGQATAGAMQVGGAVDGASSTPGRLAFSADGRTLFFLESSFKEGSGLVQIDTSSFKVRSSSHLPYEGVRPVITRAGARLPFLAGPAGSDRLIAADLLGKGNALQVRLPVDAPQSPCAVK